MNNTAFEAPVQEIIRFDSKDVIITSYTQKPDELEGSTEE